MPDFNVRADSVNVEQIMEQIRARIRDKRGVDYTEDQIRELASVKLEKFLDPRSIRSDLLEQFRKSQPPAAPVTVPLYPFEDTTLFDSHRGIIRFFRRLFRPLLKLFFNSNALAQSLHQQTIINRQTVDRLDALEASVRQRGDLYYELLHNLVVELTRATIEVKNISMRVESIASRLEFNERRTRALESAVVYKPAEGREGRSAPAAPPPTSAPQRSGGFVPREGQRQSQGPMSAPRAQPATPAPTAPAPAGAAPPTVAAAGEASPASDAPVPAEGPGQRSRRRRRRRGRRGGASAAAIMGAGGQAAPGEAHEAADEEDEAAHSNAASGGPAAPAASERPAQPAGQTTASVPPEPREAEPIRPPSPAEPSAGDDSRPSPGSRDVDDL